MSKGILGVPTSFLVSAIVVTFLLGQLSAVMTHVLEPIESHDIDQQLESLGDDIEQACMDEESVGELNLDPGYEAADGVTECGEDGLEDRSICFDRNVYTPELSECESQLGQDVRINIDDSEEMAGEVTYLASRQVTDDVVIEVSPHEEDE